MKTCPKCLKSEPDVTFGIARSRYDGKTPYCRTCWTLYVQQGRWAKGTKPVTPFLERLWEGIQVCEHGDSCRDCCWIWLKSHDQDGYAKFTLTNAAKRHITLPATNVIYEIWYATPIPTGLVVAHECDWPSCVNPLHFWLGTLAQNRADCVQKGRQAKGLTSGHTTHPEVFSNVTKEDIRTIRALYTSGTSITKLTFLYPLSEFVLRRMVKGKTWKYI